MVLSQAVNRQRSPTDFGSYMDELRTTVLEFYRKISGATSLSQRQKSLCARKLLISALHHYTCRLFADASNFFGLSLFPTFVLLRRECIGFRFKTQFFCTCQPRTLLAKMIAYSRPSRKPLHLRPLGTLCEELTKPFQTIFSRVLVEPYTGSGTSFIHTKEASTATTRGNIDTKRISKSRPI